MNPQLNSDQLLALYELVVSTSTTTLDQEKRAIFNDIKIKLHDVMSDVLTKVQDSSNKEKFSLLKDTLEKKEVDEKIKLKRDFWPKADVWEDELLKHIARSNFHSFFKPIRRLGKGAFASVYLAEDVRIKRRTAIKAFSKDFFRKPLNCASL